MSAATHKKIPVNIISGPLGVGKTTTINHLLQQRPKNERWAVLVNEYGLVGLDAALMEAAPVTKGAPGIEIKEVAGGCICCSAGFMFEVSLVMLLQRRPDRLLIEPTGLAALSGILDTLDRKGIREAVDVRSVVCILDPARREETLLRKEVQDQVEAADVLLAGRADVAKSEQLEEFHTWAKALYPPKRHIAQVEYGRISLSLLDLVAAREETVPRAHHRHGTDHDTHDHHDHGQHAHDDHNHENHSHDHDDHDHVHDHHGHNHHDHAKESTNEIHCDASNPIVERSHRSSVTSTIGWICWDGLVFDAERVSCWLGRLSQLPGSLRTKAVLHTNEGWWAFNFVDGTEEVRPSAYRRDSRLEVIIESDDHPDTATLTDQLRTCLVTA